MIDTRKKKSEISADFSVVGGSGKKNPWKKSFEKILAKNRRFFPKKKPIFSEKKPIFSNKYRFFLGKKFSDFFSGSKNVKKMLLTGFEPTQNA